MAESIYPESTEQQLASTNGITLHCTHFIAEFMYIYITFETKLRTVVSYKEFTLWYEGLLQVTIGKEVFLFVIDIERYKVMKGCTLHITSVGL